MFSVGGLFRVLGEDDHREPLELSPIRGSSCSPSHHSVSFSTENIEKDSTTRRSQTRLRHRPENLLGTQVGEELYQRGQDLIQKRLEKAEEIFRSTYTFRPQIDENSKKITLSTPRKPLYSQSKPALPPPPVAPSPKPTSKTMDLTAFLARNYGRPQRKVRDQRYELSAERKREKENKSNAAAAAVAL